MFASPVIENYIITNITIKVLDRKRREQCAGVFLNSKTTMNTRLNNSHDELKTVLCSRLTDRFLKTYTKNLKISSKMGGEPVEAGINGSNVFSLAGSG